MRSDLKNREYDKFRSTQDPIQSKVAVKVEQDIYDEVPVRLDVEDSFNRLKVAPPHLLFDSSFQYSLQSKVFIRSELLGATITHNPLRAAANIACSATAGSRARFRSRNYFQYSPSFSNTIVGSFNFQGSANGVTKRIGLYDEKNGYILELSDGKLKLGIRSSIGGSQVTTYVNQENWNVDKFDGTGISGVDLDYTKQQIFYCQFQWLGSGQVEFGFSYNGRKYPAHKFQTANIGTGLYSQTATLPIQAEILNVSGSASYMEFTCCSVVSNGATAMHGHLHVASSGITPRVLNTVGQTYPILAVRKAPNYSDIPIQILDLNAFSTSNDDFLIEVIHKPTLVNPVWVNIPNSFSQKDQSSTGYSGGDIVAQFYMKGNLQASEKLELLSRFWDLTLGNDFDGNSEIMLMAATPLTTNATLYGIISFKEFE
jgi:hypothetical protein